MIRAPQHMRGKLGFAFEFDQQHANSYSKWRASWPFENAFVFVDEGNWVKQRRKGSATGLCRRFKSAEVFSE